MPPGHRQEARFLTAHASPLRQGGTAARLVGGWPTSCCTPLTPSTRRPPATCRSAPASYQLGSLPPRQGPEEWTSLGQFRAPPSTGRCGRDGSGTRRPLASSSLVRRYVAMAASRGELSR